MDIIELRDGIRWLSCEYLAMETLIPDPCTGKFKSSTKYHLENNADARVLQQLQHEVHLTQESTLYCEDCDFDPMNPE